MAPSEVLNGVMTMVPYDEDRPERAKHNLQYDVAAFGIREAFEAFCGDLESRLGWKLEARSRTPIAPNLLACPTSYGS
jgi:hypothetical protein